MPAARWRLSAFSTRGFYNLLGFGNGSYQNHVRFDPATLTINGPFRPPQRIGREQWRDVHAAMHARLRGHGGCVLNLPEIARYDMAALGTKTIGLGYFDGPGGTLSHFLWGKTEGEYGPYGIYYYAYQTPVQLFELLALIKSLGDQVSLFSMEEPPEIQFQDLLARPFRNRTNTRGSKFANSHGTRAYWQARMLDVPKCLEKTRLDTESLTFNLALNDPIVAHLNPANAWRGCAGDYVVTLGKQSGAEPGRSASLPVLTASVGAFTRLWLGVRNASSLTLTRRLARRQGLAWRAGPGIAAAAAAHRVGLLSDGKGWSAGVLACTDYPWHAADCGGDLSAQRIAR